MAQAAKIVAAGLTATAVLGPDDRVRLEQPIAAQERQTRASVVPPPPPAWRHLPLSPTPSAAAFAGGIRGTRPGDGRIPTPPVPVTVPVTDGLAPVVAPPAPVPVAVPAAPVAALGAPWARTAGS